jgi:O-antigen/teichoic acid export membrane protein
MTDDSQTEQTSRFVGVFAYVIFTLLSGVTSILVARVLTSTTYGSYSAKMSLVNTVGTIALFGANYKIMRDVAKSDLLATARLYFLWSMISIFVVGTILIPVVGAPPLIFVASCMLVLSHLLFAMLVRLSRKNTVLTAQITSAAVLLLAALLLALFDVMTESTFIFITSASFSVGFVWQLGRHWYPQDPPQRNRFLARSAELIKSGLSLQILYVPTLLVTALLPALASLTFSTREVSSIAAVMSYGTAFQFLGSFLIYSVFVPNVTNLRDSGSNSVELRRELRRQDYSLGLLSIGFLTTVGFIGDDLLPVLMGDSYSSTAANVVAVSLLYVLQALIFSQTAFGLLLWPKRLFTVYQIGALCMMAGGVGLALLNAGTTLGFLLVIAGGYLACFVVSVVINTVVTHESKVCDE